MNIHSKKEMENPGKGEIIPEKLGDERCPPNFLFGEYLFWHASS
jgi:hypothetical protein